MRNRGIFCVSIIAKSLRTETSEWNEIAVGKDCVDVAWDNLGTKEVH